MPWSKNVLMPYAEYESLKRLRDEDGGCGVSTEDNQRWLPEFVQRSGLQTSPEESELLKASQTMQNTLMGEPPPNKIKPQSEGSYSQLQDYNEALKTLLLRKHGEGSWPKQVKIVEDKEEKHEVGNSGAATRSNMALQALNKKSNRLWQHLQSVNPNLGIGVNGELVVDNTTFEGSHISDLMHYATRPGYIPKATPQHWDTFVSKVLLNSGVPNHWRGTAKELLSNKKRQSSHTKKDNNNNNNSSSSSGGDNSHPVDKKNKHNARRTRSLGASGRRVTAASNYLGVP